MEIICKVVEIGALEQRTFTDRNGQNQQINERTIKLKNRGNLIVGKMVGNTAGNFVAPAQFFESDLWACNMEVMSREYNGQNGTTYFTDVRINYLEKL